MEGAMSSVLNGIAAAEKSMATDRIEAQQELSNFIAGYEKNDSGKYIPNERGQNTLDVNNEATKQTLMQLDAQNQLMQGRINSEDMTQATTHLAMGNIKDAWAQIEKNPVLKKQLQDQFGVVTIAPIDWENDRALFNGSGINVDNVNGEALDALNSSFFKYYDKNGVAKLGNVHNLMKSTNYDGYIDSATRRAMEKRLDYFGQVLKGHVITPQEQRIKDNSTQAIENKSELDAEVSGLKLQELYNMIANNPDMRAKEILDKINPLSLADQKKKLEISKMQGDADSKAKLGDIDQAKFYNDMKTLPINKETLDTATLLQGDRKPTTEERKSINGKFALAKAFDKFSKYFENQNIDADAVSKMRLAIDKVWETDKTPEEKRQYVTELKLGTEFKTLMFEYIKYMSGAAVSDNEKTDYFDIIASGKWSNKDAAGKSLRSFADTLLTSSYNNLEQYYGYPRDYMLARQMMESYNPLGGRYLGTNIADQSYLDKPVKQIKDLNQFMPEEYRGTKAQPAVDAKPIVNLDKFWKD